MTAYEFYWHDAKTGSQQLVGLIPERRRNLERVDRESVINLGKMLMGDDTDAKNIFFVKVTIDKGGNISYPKPSLGF
jgi:hypothetical protein